MTLTLILAAIGLILYVVFTERELKEQSEKLYTYEAIERRKARNRQFVFDYEKEK